MGWTSYHAKHYKNGKVDRKAECDSVLNHETEKHKYTVLKSTMKSTVYYGAVEHIDKEENTREVFAVVFLTAGQDKRDPYYNFAYKDMTETMYPYYFDCPKSILDLLTPTDNETANRWRAKCREMTKQTNWLKELPIGAKVLWRDKYVLQKCAPAYQFKTWWWYNAEKHTYVSKKYVTMDNTKEVAV